MLKYTKYLFSLLVSFWVLLLQSSGPLTSPNPPLPRTRYCLKVFFVTGCLSDTKTQTLELFLSLLSQQIKNTVQPLMNLLQQIHVQTNVPSSFIDIYDVMCPDGSRHLQTRLG